MAVSYRHEQRSETRIERIRPTTLNSTKRSHCGHSFDLSRGGAAVWVPTAPSLHSRVDVSVELEDGPVRLQGIVRRVQVSDDGYEVGVEFVDVSPEATYRIVESIGRPPRPEEKRKVERPSLVPRTN